MKISVPRVMALVVTGSVLLSASAFAAGIDSRTYTCANLQRLIAVQGFVFISQPVFGDFVVATPY